MTDTSGTAPFFRLLRELGLDREPGVALSVQPPGGPFVMDQWLPAADAAERALSFNGKASVWFGVHPMAARPALGRGRKSDITGVLCLPADLDDKSLDLSAQAFVVRALSELLAVDGTPTPPVAIVNSGGGRQPYWAIERVDRDTGEELLDRWKLVVQHLASSQLNAPDADHSEPWPGSADSVFDLPRVLRVPGPLNLKPEYGAGAPTSVHFPAGPVVEDPNDPDYGRRRRLDLGTAWKALAGYDLPQPEAVPLGARGETPDVAPGTGTPLDDFEARTDWSEILEAAGAKFDHRDSDGTIYWTRPGKASGVSATTGYARDRDRLYVHTSNWPPFEQHGLYTKQGAWALLNGFILSGDRPDMGAAARHLASKGYGGRRQDWTSDASSSIDWSTVGNASRTLDTVPVVGLDRGVLPAGPPSSPPAAPDVLPASNPWTPSSVQQVQPTAAPLPAPPAVGDDPDLDPVLAACYLPEEFWNARPILGFLRQAARAAEQSPEGVLAAGLGLALGHVMPNVVLPACIGTEASLNIMTVTVGSSGDGKSVCRKIAKGVLQFRTSAGLAEPVWEFPPASGQGIAGQYQILRKPRGGEQFMETIRVSALATVEESDKIKALSSSAGSTLSSELRAAAMGELIGSGNIGETKTNMPEGSYRFVLAMCMQPELSGWLLDEQAGGLPQRFLFACVRDSRIVTDVTQPGTWSVVLPHEATLDPMSGAPRSRTVMGVTDAICTYIREEARERKRALGRGLPGDEFDGHATLLRLKVAGALALVEGRLEISDEDFALAGMVTDASKATIRWTQSILAELGAKKAGQQRDAKVADARAITAATVETTENKIKIRCAKAVLRKLEAQGEHGETKGVLQAGISTAQKEVLTDVLDGLLDAGRIRFEDILKDGKQVGSRWFIT